MKGLPAPAIFAINHLLGQASWAREKLAPFAGHTAQVKLPPFEAAFTVLDNGQLVAPAANAEPEVTIALPLIAPLLLLQGPDAVMRSARLEGSADFAQALGFVIRNLRWDIEEDLSKLFGDIAAHRVVEGTRTLASEQQKATLNLAENFAEYFTEEQPLIARRGDLEEFSSDVATLRDDLARLEKRVSKFR